VHPAAWYLGKDLKVAIKQAIHDRTVRNPNGDRNPPSSAQIGPLSNQPNSESGGTFLYNPLPKI